MAWKRATWVDDDGSLTLGTLFSAANMNNIEVGIEGLVALLEGSGMGAVVHGTEKAVARPAGFDVVFWIGTVEPEHAATNDPWVNPNDWSYTPPRDYGIVEALPTGTIVVGSYCNFKAAAGVYWRLVYTAESGTYPWNVIGPAPLVGEQNAEATQSNVTTYTSLTSPVEITAPLKGEYVVTVEANINVGNAGQGAILSYSVGSTVANDNWAGAMTGAGSSNGQDVVKTTKQTIGAAEKFIEKGKTSASGAAGYRRRRLIVTPLRVGS